MISAAEDVRLGEQVTAEAVLKATLLSGTGGKLGRFHVLRQLGEGGMGLVFVAYDEELDRKVAIKLLRSRQEEGSLGRGRLLREAQALARLSHPNVVTVYEVGEYERQVFVAMEFVQGRSLHDWLRGATRSWREVVGVFVEAGRGLAAAHAAEILHRDFKPANVLLGDDGRVRVADFGLALAQDRREVESEITDADARLYVSTSSLTGSQRTSPLTMAGTIVGTPPYMAPERFIHGGPIDARADQYSFCVALYEGLYGSRPFVADDFNKLRQRVLGGTIPEPPRGSRVPSWLRKVVLRGLSRLPDDRFPSMPALLAALTRDPERARRRVIGGLALAGALVGGGYAAARVDREAAAPACPDARAQLDPVWDERRDDVGRALLATGVPYAPDTWVRVQQQLDLYADAWAAAHRDACLAHQRGEQSDALLDLRMTCLQRRRGELSALVDRLALADQETTRAAVAAASELPAIERCADAGALTAAIAPPDDPAIAAQVAGLRDRLAQARAAGLTRKLAEGAAIASEVVGAAQALAYRPLLAEAMAVRGNLTSLRGVYDAARDELIDALWLADGCRDDALLAEVMADLVYLFAEYRAEYDAALAWRRHADAVITRLGEGSPGHASLLHAFATAHYRRGDHDEAKTLLTRSLALAERLFGEGDRRLIAHLIGLGNLAFLGGAPSEGRPFFERALAIAERAYGPSHPETADIIQNLGSTAAVLDDFERAQELLERALAIEEGALGRDHPGLSAVLGNLGGVLARRQQFPRAREMLTRALELDERALGPDHPDLAGSLHNLGLLLGDMGDDVGSRGYLERALEIRRRIHPPGHVEIAESLTELGRLDLRTGEVKRATAQIEEALAMLSTGKTGGSPGSKAYAQFVLAEAMRAAGRPGRAAELANAAMAGYRAIDEGHFADRIAEIEAWLAEPAGAGP